MAVISNPNQIRAFRLLTILKGMELELAHPGHKISRVNVFNVARRELGEFAPRRKVDVHRAFVYHLVDIGLLIPAEQRA
jgi:hypothetical protein